MSKHTPGLWEWDEPSNWLGLSARVWVRDPYGLIAQVQISGWKPKSMALANAQLIAASPDLLAACKRMLAFDQTQAASYLDILDTMQAAVAKAEGK